ncbi:hypothetical protein [Streptomyces griseus]|uniref:hypothetical protein n=1 Tax=Streptomyces griseus TaxID=1911 RepID=UPI0036FB6185
MFDPLEVLGPKLPRLICTLRFCLGVTTNGYDANSGTAIFQVAAMRPRTITASRDMARRTRWKAKGWEGSVYGMGRHDREW